MIIQAFYLEENKWILKKYSQTSDIVSNAWIRRAKFCWEQSLQRPVIILKENTDHHFVATNCFVKLFTPKPLLRLYVSVLFVYFLEAKMLKWLSGLRWKNSDSSCLRRFTHNQQEEQMMRNLGKHKRMVTIGKDPENEGDTEGRGRSSGGVQVLKIWPFPSQGFCVISKDLRYWVITHGASYSKLTCFCFFSFGCLYWLDQFSVCLSWNARGGWGHFYHLGVGSEKGMRESIRGTGCQESTSATSAQLWTFFMLKFYLRFCLKNGLPWQKSVSHLIDEETEVQAGEMGQLLQQVCGRPRNRIQVSGLTWSRVFSTKSDCLISPAVQYRRELPSAWFHLWVEMKGEATRTVLQCQRHRRRKVLKGKSIKTCLCYFLFSVRGSSKEQKDWAN